MINSCKMSGNNPDHHFTGSGKQIEFGKGATQVVEDYQLSRFACYLIAQNDPWEKKKVQVLNSIKRRSQVQRDYDRIIREIGTPAPVPKPRGKSPGRQLGQKIGERPDRPVMRKSVKKVGDESKNPANKPKRSVSKRKQRDKPLNYSRMRRIWSKNRPAPMRC